MHSNITYRKDKNSNIVDFVVSVKKNSRERKFISRKTSSMASTSQNNDRSRRTRKRRKNLNYGKNNSYSHHIYKLMKTTCPGLSIGVTAMNVMNSFVEDLLERIASEASTLVQHSKKSTMGFDDIISATKLVITTPELCEYAIEMAYYADDAWSVEHKLYSKFVCYVFDGKQKCDKNKLETFLLETWIFAY